MEEDNGLGEGADENKNVEEVKEVYFGIRIDAERVVNSYKGVKNPGNEWQIIWFCAPDT